MHGLLKAAHQILLIFDLLPYPIDLICLALVVSGGRCQHNWRISIKRHSQSFHITFVRIFEISFFFTLAWLKNLKDPFEEDSLIVGPDISHIFTYASFSKTFIGLASMVEKFEFWWT